MVRKEDLGANVGIGWKADIPPGYDPLGKNKGVGSDESETET
jgi:hypothetical protein